MISYLIPTPGYLIIKPPTSSSTLTLPEAKGLLRMGEVIAEGGEIYHVSGNMLPVPCKVGDTVIFKYIEDQDIETNGEHLYIVAYNSVGAVVGGKNAS